MLTAAPDAILAAVTAPLAIVVAVLPAVVVTSPVKAGIELAGICPDQDTAKVPVLVIGVPLTDNPEGTVIATLVTVPVPPTEAQEGTPAVLSVRASPEEAGLTR